MLEANSPEELKGKTQFLSPVIWNQYGQIGVDLKFDDREAIPVMYFRPNGYEEWYRCYRLSEGLMQLKDSNPVTTTLEERVSEYDVIRINRAWEAKGGHGPAKKYRREPKIAYFPEVIKTDNDMIGIRFSVSERNGKFRIGYILQRGASRISKYDLREIFEFINHLPTPVLTPAPDVVVSEPEEKEIRHRRF